MVLDGWTDKHPFLSMELLDEVDSNIVPEDLAVEPFSDNIIKVWLATEKLILKMRIKENMYSIDYQKNFERLYHAAKLYREKHNYPEVKMPEKPSQIYPNRGGIDLFFQKYK